MTIEPPVPGDDELEPTRREAQGSLERAVGEGRLTLEAFTERAGVVWSAGSRGEIDRMVADLPQPVVGSRAPARSTMISLFGNIKRRGRWTLRRKTTALMLFGDLKLDLRGAVVSDPEVTITAVTLFGDVEITVPEGVEVELSGFDIFGDREFELAPVTRVPGSPLARVRAFTLFGDVEIRSKR
ncbi:MAG: DUF1707 SHOCT-like domain-containing protein [Pseudonocardiaceae bacterium]